MIRMFKKKRNKKGFTLIELIVVIAILGILAAIAIPRFMNQTTTAKLRADQATARNIVGALNIAIAEGDAQIDGTDIKIKTVTNGVKGNLAVSADVIGDLTKLDLLDGVGNAQSEDVAFVVKVATSGEATEIVKAGGIIVGTSTEPSKFYPVKNN